MKIGAENKKELYAMLVLMAIAVLFLVRTFLPSGTPAPVSASAPATTASQPGVAVQNAPGRGKAAPLLDPTLRTDLLKNSEGSEYRGTGRNIFEAQATPPPVIQRKEPVEVNPGPPQPVLPPPPPPIPLKFYGFANKTGQQKSIF